MPPRTFPTSNGSTDADRAIDAILARLVALESGRHRGPGSSFGVPLRITNGTTTWQLHINADTGDLVVVNEQTGTSATLALA